MAKKSDVRNEKPVYAVLSENSLCLEVVRIIRNKSASVHMIRIKVNKHFFNSGDYRNCFQVVEYNQAAYIGEKDLVRTCSAGEFNKYYKVVIKHYIPFL